jgi:hypothetical protein
LLENNVFKPLPESSRIFGITSREAAGGGGEPERSVAAF